MGKKFFTDDSVEDFLTEEIRSLPLSNGTFCPVAGFKLTWANYEIVLQHGSLSAPEITMLMRFYADKMGYSLSHALRDVLIPLRTEANRKIDEKLSVHQRKMTCRAELRRQFHGAAAGTVQEGESSPPEGNTPLIFRKVLD